MFDQMIASIVSLGRASAAPVKLDIPDVTKAHFLTGNGQIVTVPIDPSPRDHTVCQLDDLIRMANLFDDGLTSCVVWYNEDHVILVLDNDAHRCQKVTMTLEISDVCRVVASLPGACYDHKSFVRLLRVQLAGALSPSSLLDIVRRVRFDNGAVTHSEVKRTRESLGREITASVSAESEIPDTVTLSVPVYSTLGETDPYPVRCTVEVDPVEGRFRLIPFPDEITRVYQLAVASIARRLAAGLSEGVPAYYGAP